MFEQFRYALQPAGLEHEFLESRFEADKRKLARLFWLLICIVTTFLVLGLLLVPSSPTLTLISVTRSVGIVVSLAGLVSLRWVSTRRALDWVGFGCLSWMVVQVGIGHSVTVVTSSVVIAWEVLAIFLLYLALPLSLRFKLILTLLLSAVSMVIWIRERGEGVMAVDYVALASVYVAANVIGFILSTQSERSAREEFQLFANEKRLKADLETAFARLEESVESRNQIYRVLAHDLRSTIGALGSIGHLLSEDEDQSEEEREELIALLCEGSKNSYELLENLLQWAISESGSVEPNPKSLSLGDMIASSVGFLEVLARDKSIHLGCEIDGPIEVWADPKMLDTVVRNLASNAIKFTQPGGSVRITARKRDDALAEVSVTDTGVGIDEERLSRLFHLRYGDSSRGTAGEKGTNLGLRICSEFVRKLGGEISATSDVGKGTQFRFTVPLSSEFSI